jgi:hypothetical protein
MAGRVARSVPVVEFAATFLIGFLALNAVVKGAPTAKNAKKQTVGAAVVENGSPPAEPLGARGRWKIIPEYLQGAEIQTVPLEKAPDGGGFRGTITTGGVVVVAAARSTGLTGDAPLVRQDVRDTRKIIEAQGWTAMGTIRENDASAGKKMTLFRRVMQAGEKLDFTTSKTSYAAPFLVVLNDQQAAAANAEKGITFLLQELSSLQPRKPAGLSADSPRNVVMLDAQELDAAGSQGPAILQQELVRQAFLLAAREELGLATRDRGLREAFPQAAAPAYVPFDFLISVRRGHPLRLAIFRQYGSEFEVLWDKELKLAPAERFDDLVAQCEALSRKEFVDVLQRAGLRKADRPNRQPAQSPTEIEAGPVDFNFIAQFASLRRLHAAVLATGESPELTAGLARTYAELGAESAFLWSPAHKSFEARGLLYAERLLRKSGAGPLSLWTRAYVRALVGRHQGALDDLAQAAKVAAGDASAIRPAWVDVIQAYCEFDQEKLNALDKNDRIRPLVRYLQMLGQEFTAGRDARLGAIGNALEVHSDSFRAMDLVAADSPTEFIQTARQQALKSFPTSLYHRLAEVPGLPEEAAKLCAAEREHDGKRDAANEMANRVKLVALLDRAAVEADRAEPSLAVLAALIRETSFVHARQMVDFQLYNVGPTEDIFAALSPLLDGHPYQKYVEALTYDSEASVASLQLQAETIDTRELELTEAKMLLHFGATKQDFFRNKFYYLAFFRVDPVYRDLTMHALRTDPNSRIPWSNYDPKSQIRQQLAHKSELQAISPHAPVNVLAEILAAEYANDLQTLLELAPAWEKKFAADPTVLAALTDFYGRLGRDDDALRVAKRAVEVFPELSPYLRLARLYRKRGDLVRWKATLDEFLEQESVDDEHAQV